MREDDGEGLRAMTDFAVVEHAGKRAAWLALQPLTGRTHQLRAHCAALGTPIVGDGKYGGGRESLGPGVADRLHLHARAIDMPHPAGGRLSVSAPLPPHMKATWNLFGFNPDDDTNPFEDR